MVAAIAISMGMIFFFVNVGYGSDIISNIIYCIGILVANIPEGLQITVTVCMALSAKRMAARKVLVKNLQSVETLGCTSCICSDKTGTLTQNKMTVSHLFVNGEVIDAHINYENALKNPSVKLGYNVKDKNFMEFVKMMALGSKANFSFNPTDDEIVQVYRKSNRIHKAEG
jgi:sodium/potassium-transporting ATPase subunit alpha